MNIIPTVIEKNSNHEYAYDLYSRLLKDRIVFIYGEIDDINANIIISELLYLGSLDHKDISVYINSPGGSVTAGLAIYDTFNYIKSDVRTISVGLSASMGAFLLSCGKKGKRMALPNSEIMIHQPLGGASGQATDVKIAAERIIKIKEKLNRILAENTNNSYKKTCKDTERDFYMEASEALKYGIIDKLFIKIHS